MNNAHNRIQAQNKEKTKIALNRVLTLPDDIELDALIILPGPDRKLKTKTDPW